MRMYRFGINLIFTSVIIFAGMVIQPQTRRPIAACRIGHLHFETICIVSSAGLHVLCDRQYPFLEACDLLPCQSCPPSPTSFGATKGVSGDASHVTSAKPILPTLCVVHWRGRLSLCTSTFHTVSLTQPILLTWICCTYLSCVLRIAWFASVKDNTPKDPFFAV